VENKEHLAKLREEHGDFLVLAFYGGFSSAAQRALKELEAFSDEHGKAPVYVIDVQKVKGVHKEFGVENVPTVIALQEGKVTRFIEGVQSARYYAHVLAGVMPKQYVSTSKKKAPKRVVVYSTPTCPACTMVKNYLRGRGIPFREVDVSRDQSAARELVRRSGQMAVPQIDIGGQLIVGFDKPKLERLLPTS
jgi:glutaredoxin-like YruB-family protein